MYTRSFVAKAPQDDKEWRMKNKKNNLWESVKSVVKKKKLCGENTPTFVKTFRSIRL
jgi:hypothetical protein